MKIAPEVADAIDAKKPIVALESTVFSTLGLPSPANGEALEAVHATIRAQHAVPAMTAIIDGEARFGVEARDFERILTCERKVAERDLGVAIGRGWPTGVTTVSASLALATSVRVRVFATGGIGGVHRDASASDDVSADLAALSRHRAVTVSAGAKSFLDLGRTLERLETLSVPVLGWQTDRFPAFTAADSGFAVPYRVDSADEIAAIATARFELGGGGLLVAVPPPAPLDPASQHTATVEAERAADAADVRGPARTPFVLSHIADSTAGASVDANVALVINNATVASQIAHAIS